MAVEGKDKDISMRIYLVAFAMFLMAVAIVVKLTNIQWVHGDYYRKLAKEHSVKLDTIEAARGNIYSADGSLLATSVSEYDIRFNAVLHKEKEFQKLVGALADSLAHLLNRPAADIEFELKRARIHGNQYKLLARNLSFSDYQRIKEFPLLSSDKVHCLVVEEEKNVRKHPMGEIAKRTIGYERTGPNGEKQGKGIELAFSQYLQGKNGLILKQKITKGRWKPIKAQNEIEPKDGFDIISTLDLSIQDITHHALLDQLVRCNADYGCAVVMETKTGKIKAIANLGRGEDSTYFEKENYAVRAAQEPGSTYKLAGLIAVLEDKKADTITKFNTNGGIIDFGNNMKVRDSKEGGYGTISLGRGFEVSSNTVLVQAVHQAYKNNPQQFIDHLDRFNLTKKLNLAIQGEGSPFVPQPGTRSWDPFSLRWMAYGYGISCTPLQILTLYNAIANNGVMVKPQFVSAIKDHNKTIKSFQPEVINPKICSQETLKKVRVILENVVKKGTGKQYYSKQFSMAGKTGTVQVNYSNKSVDMSYIASFVGYFPADNPKYSCIVLVNNPDKAGQYYGAEVALPVFKRIAQKIYSDTPPTDYIKYLSTVDPAQEKSNKKYYALAESSLKVVPNLQGMPGMDAVALLENLKLKVKVVGNGKVAKQSILPGQPLQPNQLITLELL